MDMCLNGSLKNSAFRACLQSTKLLSLGVMPWKAEYLINPPIDISYTKVEDHCVGTSKEVQEVRREGCVFIVEMPSCLLT